MYKYKHETILIESNEYTHFTIMYTPLLLPSQHWVIKRKWPITNGNHRLYVHI